MTNPVVVLAVQTLSMTAPLLLACMGGYLSERSGVVNIGLEGKMLIGAAGVAIMSGSTQNAYLGLAAGLACSVAFGGLHWFLTQKFKIDGILSGMGINLIALGLSDFWFKSNEKAQSGDAVPVISQNLLLAFAFAIPLVLAWVAVQTRWGLKIRAAGADADKARLSGLDPVKIRLVTLLLSGLLCGLAGALLISKTGRFTNGMTDGAGYIALGALILGGWRPISALFACVGFALFQALQLILQGSKLGGVAIPTEFWNALPFLACVLALGFTGKSQAPEGLGKV